MKRILLISIGILLVCNGLIASYYSYLPYTIRQPDGVKIDCFVSGDEHYNWLHDQAGYTIIQAPDGYFYYGEVSGDQVVPTRYKVNSVNPASVGLKKWARISVKEYNKKAAFLNDYRYSISPAPHTGTLNNLVVFIRFSDDMEFTDTRQTFDSKFNQVPGISVQSYFTEVSYSQFAVSSTYYPACDLATNLSYQDSHPRSYFEPYNETTNPGGYTGGDNGGVRTAREHTLLKDAIDWINANSPVPGGLNIDGDNDGFVDNVCFNVRGNCGAWASLLWAHSWALSTENVYINGKRVYKFTFQPENQIEVRTLCHEMFHSVGAPDLYHYSYDGLQPVQNWDLMEQGFGHMSAYMKWKYAAQTWITGIPEINTTGEYTLNPLSSSTNNCYKIASPNSTSQFFVLEYRKKESGSFEDNLPGSGLLVYRIDPSYTGNANGPPDEVYLYRPGGTVSANGSPSSAYYSSESGRISINSGTNPASFLQNGDPGGLNISNVTSAGSTISFTVSISTVANPSDFTATAAGLTAIDMAWLKNISNNDVVLACSTSPAFGVPEDGTLYTVGNAIPGGGTVIYAGSALSWNHTGLSSSTTFFYKIWSVSSGKKYSGGISRNANTLCETVTTLPWSEGFALADIQPACWTQADHEGNGQIWQFGTIPDASYYESPVLSGNYAYLNSDGYGDFNSQNADLVTPEFDFSAYTRVSLLFNHYFKGFEGSVGVLSYSVDNGSSWTTLETFITTLVSNPVAYVQEIAAVAGHSQVKFKWNYTGTFGFFWAIDDIQVTGSCDHPDAAGAITGTATISAGTAGNPYSVALIAGATSYIWSYNGTGVTIHGSGREVTLDFSPGATAGRLAVKGRNNCGDGAGSFLDISSINTLTLKVFLEGAYVAESGVMSTVLNTYLPLAQPFIGAPWNYAGTEAVLSIPAGVVDWVLVELRDAPSAALATSETRVGGWPRAFFLKSDGSIVDLNGTSKPDPGEFTVSGNLYVVIWHRNHLAIMSAFGATVNSGSYSYDFTTGIAQVYGGTGGYKQVGSGPTVYAMVCGDIDQDGHVFVSDYNLWAGEFGHTLGNFNADLNMDGNVFVSDYNKWAANFGIGIPGLKFGLGVGRYFSWVPR